MSKEDRYLIESPTLAVFDDGGQYVSNMVPAGSIVIVDGKALDGEKLIPVRWAEKQAWMFTLDIIRRGKKLEDREA